MVNAKKAFKVGYSKGRRLGLKKGSSITPRLAYSRGYKAGASRVNAKWTKRAATQADYYYKMGKGSR